MGIVFRRKRSGRWVHPRATMQKLEKKWVAGGATWKLLKIKVQICSIGVAVLQRDAERRVKIGEKGRV